MYHGGLQVWVYNKKIVTLDLEWQTKDMEKKDFDIWKGHLQLANKQVGEIKEQMISIELLSCLKCLHCGNEKKNQWAKDIKYIDQR